MQSTAPPLTGDFALIARSWKRSLLAANLSPRTIESYTDAVELLGAYLAEQHMPLTLAALSREHVESFIADQLARHKATTAAVRYRGVHRFFVWAVEEGEIPTSPMVH